MPADTSPKRYYVNDIFYSLQGEGLRQGTANLFLRFAGCNMSCDIERGARSPGGFACDTEFVSSVSMTADDITARCVELTDPTSRCGWIICTGGEPTLQLDKPLVDHLHAHGYRVAIETNGSKNVDELGLDWITVSPKVAEHALKQRRAHEVKYVRNYGQGLPKTQVVADYYLISPAFNGLELDPKTVQWCIDLVKKDQLWRLTLQAHKFLNIS